MKSIADALIEEGLEKGLEQGLEQGIRRGRQSGKVEVLIRLLRRRFGLTAEEEMIVRSCQDDERLDAAAEACVDMDADKTLILSWLSSKE